MSEIKVNKISPRTNCGTVQLGDSGDTFTIPAGATINNQGTATNFGATGSASWVTTVKTSTFTAVAGEGYFVNTTGGAVTVNLPAGTAGAVVAVKDYANTFDTNNCIIVQNGSDKIGGDTTNVTLSTEGIAVTLVFVDSTQGWLVTDSGLQSEAPGAQYITATGGTITTSGDFKIHTFTGPGTFAVCAAGNSGGSNKVSYMTVAGGGGGGFYGGGGGAGGFREGKAPFCAPYTASPIACTSGANAGLPVSIQSYPITVGGGGAGGSGSPNPGTKGSDSIFSTITSTGGGFGAAGPSSNANGGPGGSGGAAAPGSPSGSGTIGNGNTPPVTPPQGNNGGTSHHEPGVYQLGGGGGGAGAVGNSVSPAGPGATAAATGGAGVTTCITASPVTRAGGGGGGSDNGPRPGGAGGSGGGGAGGQDPGPSPTGTAGTTNTGGGGGAGGGSGSACGAAGGSGIVVIRYKFQ